MRASVQERARRRALQAVYQWLMTAQEPEEFLGPDAEAPLSGYTRNDGTVVLTHFVPGDMPSITDEMWAAGVKKHFRGRVVVGRDLLEI